MEEVKASFENLRIQESAKVGVYYHPDCLLHKSTHEHPERPERVVSIWDRFKQKNLLSRCKVFSDYEPADTKVISECHGEDYVEYVESMWDENSKKEVRFFTDTYYNKHSTRVAKLAVNAVVSAVNLVLENKLSRVFALVRPPGHHAAAKSNRIQGFCIYNTVAVAAKYALTKPGIKKVVIFDWDVHHGDSTCKMFYENPSVLYISLHRYDDGGFYPQGTLGGVDMIGKKEGEGYNVNIPWDLPHAYETIGDDEYIFILERVLIPIIKGFNPDMMFISSGFDSGRGDPLGGIDVTPDGFAYMTKRLMEICPTRTILALEGGYNLDTLADSAEACMRIFLGEEMPLVSSENGKIFEEMKRDCAPNLVAQQISGRAVTIFKKYWPKLEDPDVVEYEKKCIGNVKEQVDVVAGHPERFIIKQDKLLKKCKPHEIESYKDLFSNKSKYAEENKIIQQFIPAFLGTFVIQEDTYLIIENYLYKHPHSSIIDIKLGKITWAPDVTEEKAERESKKVMKTTSPELGIRVSGSIKRDPVTKAAEISARQKGYFSITKDNIHEYLSNFFRSKPTDELDLEMMNYFIGFIEKLLEFFETKNTRSWFGSSLLFIYNKPQKYYKVGWIDLGYCYPLEDKAKDENTIFGLQNVLKIFKELK